MKRANRATSFAGRRDRANHLAHPPLLHHHLLRQPPLYLLHLLHSLLALFARGVRFKAVGRHALQTTVHVVSVANIALNKAAVPPRSTRALRARLFQLHPLLTMQPPCHHYLQLRQLPYRISQHLLQFPPTISLSMHVQILASPLTSDQYTLSLWQENKLLSSPRPSLMQNGSLVRSRQRRRSLCMHGGLTFQNLKAAKFKRGLLGHSSSCRQ